ncbi:MAG: hypothetical protein LPK07_01935 [Hymenobacteraceae bacterium]|nr:hypothetical protein [Hymenobacteraceae bacterium]MDX5480422.1 hypothetical protein [Hymenobacteraceae bacterium]
MNKNKFKAAILSFAAAAFMMFGLSACDKGTEPGETNVERSDIRDEGELIEREDVQYGEADSLEEHYDHADHEDHEDNTNKAIGDGAYDGKGDGIQRDEVQ